MKMSNSARLFIKESAQDDVDPEDDRILKIKYYLAMQDRLNDEIQRLNNALEVDDALTT